MSRPLRVGFVLHVMQVAGAEVLVREVIRRAGNRIVPTVFCLDAVGRMGEEMRREGIDLVCFDRKPGRDWGVSWRMARAIFAPASSIKFSALVPSAKARFSIAFISAQVTSMAREAG